MRGWKILGIGALLLILSPLVGVAQDPEVPCPVDQEDQTVDVTYSIEEQGITFTITPWIVDVCKESAVLWTLNGPPLEGTLEVNVKKEHGNPTPGNPPPWAQSGVQGKKAKLGPFPHKGKSQNDKLVAEEGTYTVILTIGGVGEITIDPGYRVWP